MMRYTYHGDRLTDPALKGMQCDPVRRPDGKCIVGKMGTAMVIDVHGVRHIVLRRRLRVNKEAEGDDETRITT
jgi:hypothetical protein